MEISYLALLRGVNVGGNNMLKMSALALALQASGLHNVRTYIQSGNVLFSSTGTDPAKLEARIRACIFETYSIDVGVVVFDRTRWQHIIASAPQWWGKNPEWKHNLLALLPPRTPGEVATAIGELKPGIEMLAPGEGVLYQSVSFKDFGRAATGKLASLPVYKSMTVRNYNTATKLAGLL
jgi:uncharacterized protein (DUF1697 family)